MTGSTLSVLLWVSPALAFGSSACESVPDSAGLFGSADGTDGESAGTGGTTATLSSTGGPTGDPTADPTGAPTADPTGGDDSPLNFDLGPSDLPPASCDPDDEECGCTAVDLLFVVDNSGSMSWLVPALTEAFPVFVDEMFSVLPMGTDLHVGIARSSGYFDPGNASGTDDPVTCVDPIVNADNPNVGVWNPPTESNTMVNGQQGRLYEYMGQRYYAVQTHQDPGPLEAWFSPAFKTAVEEWTLPHSNSETVVAGAAYPFHPVNADHNDGFMRQNSVLILYLVSNHSDMTPDEIPTSDFVEMVRDAKASCGGNACIVTAGALPVDNCYDQPGNLNTRFTDFLDGFGKPPASLLDISNYPEEPDFTGALGEALAQVVAATCEKIPPEG